MRALITGGAGFIGSHLCEALLDNSYEVICLDNLLTGIKNNIEHLFRNKAFRFEEISVCDPFHTKDKIDIIFHLASPASPKDYMKYPLETLKANSIGTLNTLELAKEKKAVYFLASTSEIYGDPDISPQTEKYNGNVSCTGPRSVYDEGKRFAESLASQYKRSFGLDIKIARFFNTYGPRMKAMDGRVIPNFIDQSLKGLPLSIYGDGSQTRSFCYIDDLIDAIIRFAGSSETGPLNLGNPNEFTIKYLADLINKMFKKPADNIRHEPLPQDDPKQRRPDISKAKKLLVWAPKIELEKGLKNTIDWFKSGH
ncbi:MAG: UDP-glucuronic acid decarboxylase family protein [Candidatus Margulisiibacteriota bacterium]